MSPTVTIDTDSEPGSWARHSVLAARADAIATGTGIFRFSAGRITHVPIDQFYADPTCARCRAVLCGCADHHWKG